MAAVRQKKPERSPGCAVEGALRFIDGKCHLLERTHRFSEIRRRVPNVTQRVLTNQLRELEADGLITRKIYAQVPPRVEYSLTPLGRSLEPVIAALKAWGDARTELWARPTEGADGLAA